MQKSREYIPPLGSDYFDFFNGNNLLYPTVNSHPVFTKKVLTSELGFKNLVPALFKQLGKRSWKDLSLAKYYIEECEITRDNLKLLKMLLWQKNMANVDIHLEAHLEEPECPDLFYDLCHIFSSKLSYTRKFSVSCIDFSDEHQCKSAAQALSRDSLSLKRVSLFNCLFSDSGCKLFLHCLLVSHFSIPELSFSHLGEYLGGIILPPVLPQALKTLSLRLDCTKLDILELSKSIANSSVTDLTLRTRSFASLEDVRDLLSFTEFAGNQLETLTLYFSVTGDGWPRPTMYEELLPIFLEAFRAKYSRITRLELMGDTCSDISFLKFMYVLITDPVSTLTATNTFKARDYPFSDLELLYLVRVTEFFRVADFKKSEQFQLFPVYFRNSAQAPYCKLPGELRRMMYWMICPRAEFNLSLAFKLPDFWNYNPKDHKFPTIFSTEETGMPSDSDEVQGQIQDVD